MIGIRNLSKKYGFRLIRSETNDGFRAIPKLMRTGNRKYYMWFEDDFIWMEKDCLNGTPHLTCSSMSPSDMNFLGFALQEHSLSHMKDD